MSCAPSLAELDAGALNVGEVYGDDMELDGDIGKKEDFYLADTEATKKKQDAAGASADAAGGEEEEGEDEDEDEPENPYMAVKRKTVKTGSRPNAKHNDADVKGTVPSGLDLKMHRYLKKANDEPHEVPPPPSPPPPPLLHPRASWEIGRVEVLALEHVHGFSGLDKKSAVLCTKSGKVVWFAAAVGVVYDPVKATHCSNLDLGLKANPNPTR